jgi:hypothetical protein
MKSQMELLRAVLEESGTRCGTSTTLDFKTIERRVEHERFSFLTITLPSFCEDFQKSLAKGSVDSTLFTSFRKRACLPVLFQGFTSQVFDASTGVLLNEPSVACIHAIRQICLLYSKIKLPCTKARVDKAIEGYIACEQEVRMSDARLSFAEKQNFRRVSHLLFGRIFSEIDRKIAQVELTPKHGPGATQEKVSGNAKFSHMRWTNRLEDVFLAGDFLFPSWRYFDADEVDFLDPGTEPPVRVVTVPKTLKTPRIIAIEPVCMQYVQQALMREFVKELESDSLVKHFIGFTHQEPNQLMARKGSLDESLATLDLSEASDRVSNQLVRCMLEPFHWLNQGVDSCRSRKADVPDHGVIRLAKFASMGSALCFPMEAMVFLTVVFMGIEDALNTRLTRKTLFEYSGQVRVYGDDIIVPVDTVSYVVSKLETFGFRVNASKSFWTGKFRESCGKEYYNGYDVSIVKCRQEFPTQRSDVSEIVSAVSLRNLLFLDGYEKSAALLDVWIEKLIPFPYVSRQSSVLGKHTHENRYDVHRMCKKLQIPLVKGVRVSARSPIDNLSGHSALLKCLLLLEGGQPTTEVDHLERAGRARSLTLKTGWGPSHL